MHIEPGVVNEVKMALSYATAAGATGLTIKSAIDTMRQSNIAALAPQQPEDQRLHGTPIKLEGARGSQGQGGG